MRSTNLLTYDSIVLKVTHSRLLSFVCNSFLYVGHSEKMPDVSYPNLFVTERIVPAFLSRVRVRYLGLGLGLEL